MISRRTFLATSVVGASAFVSRGETKPALQVGLIADPQYADVPTVGTRHYRQSLSKLGTAIEFFNGQPIDFCVNAGDTIDRDWQSFDPVLKVFEKSRHKFHHVLGNHDFEVEDRLKTEAPKRLGLERRYYSVAKAGLCFVMLDTNDVSVYAHPLASKETTDAVAALNRVAATRVIHGQPWNGAVGAEQQKWFTETCRKAAEAKEKVVVFSHHPIFPWPNNHNAWNSDTLLRMVDENKNIIAWINGHNHYGAYAARNGAHFITLRGMVETPDTNAFSVARFYEDRFEIAGNGREPSREIKHRAT